jgi:CRISP-associated protein Cas1
MRKLLNTLYITKQDSYLHKERETLVVRHENVKLGQFPILTIGNIFCFGQISVSPFLMGHCCEKGVGLSYYTEYGKFLARVQGKESGNVILRRTQYRWADNSERSLGVSRNMIAAKIINSKTILMRELRNHGCNKTISDAVEKLDLAVKVLKKCSENDILGIEGNAASVYFGVFNELIRQKEFVFSGRVRRPPTDPVNAMLSFVYSLLTHECASALQGVGLDPYVGFLHKDRPGRVSLALDLIEEFRSCIADRFVLTLINRRQIQVDDFVLESSGAYRLKDDSRKKLLAAYQERKNEEILHPYLNETIPIGLLPHCQAMLLARHIRGDIKHYVPYIIK